MYNAKDLNSYTLSDLIKICRQLQLPTSGRKVVLIDRISSDLMNKNVSINSLFNPHPSVDPDITRDILINKERHEKSNQKALIRPKCLCGNGPFTKNNVSKSTLICCQNCNKYYRSNCYKINDDSTFTCIWCRIDLIDPFYELDRLLICYQLKSDQYEFKLDTQNLRHWRSNMKEVIITCHRVDQKNIYNEWPNTLSLLINGNKELDITAPTWEHKRRDAPFKMTTFLRTSTNKINLNSTNYEKNPGVFIICIGLYTPLTIPQIMAKIQEKQQMDFMEARDRVLKLVANKQDDEDVQCMEISRRIKLNCPITFTRIEIPCRGHLCEHLQCYDLQGYLRVTQNMRAFNMRWKCPECSLFVRPKDLVVDNFVLHLLRSTCESTSMVTIEKTGQFLVVDEEDLINESQRATRERMLASSTSTNPMETPPKVSYDQTIEILELEEDGNESEEEEYTQQQHSRLNSETLKSASPTTPLPSNAMDTTTSNQPTTPLPQFSPPPTPTQPPDNNDVILLSDSDNSDDEPKTVPISSKKRSNEISSLNQMLQEPIFETNFMDDSHTHLFYENEGTETTLPPIYNHNTHQQNALFSTYGSLFPYTSPELTNNYIHTPDSYQKAFETNKSARTNHYQNS